LELSIHLENFEQYSYESIEQKLSKLSKLRELTIIIWVDILDQDNFSTLCRLSKKYSAIISVRYSKLKDPSIEMLIWKYGWKNNRLDFTSIETLRNMSSVD